MKTHNPKLTTGLLFATFPATVLATGFWTAGSEYYSYNSPSDESYFGVATAPLGTTQEIFDTGVGTLKRYEWYRNGSKYASGNATADADDSAWYNAYYNGWC